MIINEVNGAVENDGGEGRHKQMSTILARRAICRPETELTAAFQSSARLGLSEPIQYPIQPNYVP